MHKYSNTIFLSLIFLFIVLFTGILLPKEEWFGCFIFIVLCIIVNSIPMVISILNNKQKKDMNLKEEILELAKHTYIKCGVVKTSKGELILKLDSSKEEYESFLEQLSNLNNIEEATIWLKNGDWIEWNISDYTDSYFKLFKAPEIPKNLIK